MAAPTLNDLTAFVTVAAHLNFRRAADELGLSPSSLSHTMRTLEQNLGVRLLNRTTRSVQPTEAGARLLARLRPVLQDLSAALREVDEFRDQPQGTLRINAPETAARLLVRHVVPPFLAKYRDMSVDIVTEGRLIDIVAERFDAGVGLGEGVPQDMIAAHFNVEARFLAVAAPRYLVKHGVPQVPDDLRTHACISHRMPSGKLFRWEFARHGQTLGVDVNGPLTLDHIGLMIDAAAEGLGIAYVPECAAQPWLADDRLVPVLPDWCPAFPGFFLYYPGRRQVPAGRRAFIEVLRQRLARTHRSKPTFAAADQLGQSSYVMVAAANDRQRHMGSGRGSISALRDFAAARRMAATRSRRRGPSP